MSDLKCPYCGSDTFTLKNHDRKAPNWRTVCQNQNCQASGPYKVTNSEAYLAWEELHNSRRFFEYTFRQCWKEHVEELKAAFYGKEPNMPIDWLNPSPEVLQARRIGYEERSEEVQEELEHLEALQEQVLELTEKLAQAEANKQCTPMAGATWIKWEEHKKALAEKFFLGQCDGIRRYSWWRDGVQYVGTTGTTLKTALQRLEKEHKEKYGE